MIAHFGGLAALVTRGRINSFPPLPPLRGRALRAHHRLKAGASLFFARRLMPYLNFPPAPITGESAPCAPSPQANASLFFARRLMPPSQTPSALRCSVALLAASRLRLIKVLRSKVIRYATFGMC